MFWNTIEHGLGITICVCIHAIFNFLNEGSCINEPHCLLCHLLFYLYHGALPHAPASGQKAKPQPHSEIMFGLVRQSRYALEGFTPWLASILSFAIQCRRREAKQWFDFPLSSLHFNDKNGGLPSCSFRELNLEMMYFFKILFFQNIICYYFYLFYF